MNIARFFKSHGLLSSFHELCAKLSIGVFSFLLSFLLLFALMRRFSFSNFLSVVQQPQLCGVILCCFLAQVLGNTWRLQCISRSFGVVLSFSKTFEIMVRSLAGGLLLCGSVGESLLKGLQLPSKGVSIVVWDRIISFSSAGIFAALCFFWIPSSFLPLYWRWMIAAGLGLLCILFLIKIPLPYHDRYVISGFLGSCVGNLFLTLAMITCLYMITHDACFVMCMLPYAFVIAFVCSFPLFFYGWGIREHLWSFAFGYLGGVPEQGILLGMCIGILSMFLIVMMYVTISLWAFLRRVLSYHL